MCTVGLRSPISPPLGLDSRNAPPIIETTCASPSTGFRIGGLMAERAAIISDIHANLEALEAVFADIDAMGVS